MDDGRSPGVEEVKSAKNLPTPAANDLRLGPKPPHVTRERGEKEREREREREGGRGRIREKLILTSTTVEWSTIAQNSCRALDNGHRTTKTQLYPRPHAHSQVKCTTV